MKVCTVHSRIPAAQANGAYNILLPEGFGVPKAFVVYHLTNSAAIGSFDTTTDFPCIGVGFGATNTAGTGFSMVNTHIVSQEDQDPSVCRSGFSVTSAVFDRNVALSITRSWRATGFLDRTIVGRFDVTGSPQSPIDMIFTVFSGNDVRAAVGATDPITVINRETPISVGFRPDLVFGMHNRQSQINDADLNFAAWHRVTGAATTQLRSAASLAYSNLNAQTTSLTRAFVGARGTRTLASTAQVAVSQFTGAGFAVTLSVTAAGHRFYFLALESESSDDFRLQNITTRSANGTSVYGTGFMPEHVMGALCSNVTVVDANPNDNTESFTLFSGFGVSRRNHNGIGTITSSTANATVTGTGSSFLQQFGPSSVIYDTGFGIIGTVSSIASDTSLTLTANASKTVTGSAYLFTYPSQFSVGFGNNDGDGGVPNEGLTSLTSSDSINFFDADVVGPGLLMNGYIENLNGDQNGFTLNYTTAPSGTPRVGWALAIKGQENNRRRRQDIIL
jgi:hypothetical protein